MPRIEDMKLTSPVTGDANRWPKLKLNAIHQKQWDETRAAMLWVVPSFSDIWYSMMVDRDGEHAWFTDQLPTAATDDKLLYLNPNFYFGLTLDERIFVGCHEIMHAMFGHCGIFFMLAKTGEIRYSDGVVLPVIFDLLNIAADYVINAQLVEAKIGTMPKDGLHWPDLIPGDMGFLDAYRLLYKKCKGKGKKPPPPGPGPVQPGRPGNQPCPPGEEPGQGGNVPTPSDDDNLPDEVKRTSSGGETQQPGSGKAFDKHLEPGQGRGKTPGEAMSERNEQQWTNAITAALESGQLRGDMPQSLIRHFKGRLEPKADWQNVYASAVTRRVGNDRYSWEHLDQQLIWRGIGAPGRVSHGCNLLVVAADSSGSINQDTLDIFLSESRGILETIKPKRIIFVQCDAAIHEWTEIDDIDDLRGEVKGGGGTNFCPVFERIKEEDVEPDLLVYLTDLDGLFPDNAPPYPVIWGSIVDNAKAPFGEVVYIPKQTESE